MAVVGLAVCFVGEVATVHKLFWGLGEDGTPVCLVAAFKYRSDD